MNRKPLAGRRIVVTRSRHQAGTLARGLRELGAEVIDIPTIEIIPPLSYTPVDEALRTISNYQWLIVTSANTVRVIGDRLITLGLKTEALATLKIAAIGASTSQALTALGLHAEVVPKEYIAESLIAALQGKVKDARILLARAAVARDIIPGELARLGATVDVVDAYRTIIPKDSIAALSAIFAATAPPPDAITFTSSSTVNNFFILLRESGIDLPQGIRALSIGPITSATLRQHGWEPAAEAQPHDVDGLIQAATTAFRD